MILNGTADGSKIIGPLRGQPPRGYVERRDPGLFLVGRRGGRGLLAGDSPPDHTPPVARAYQKALRSAGGGCSSASRGRTFMPCRKANAMKAIKRTPAPNPIGIALIASDI